jgi:hypothetical protein
VNSLPAIQFELILLSKLTVARRNGMYRLLTQHFDGVSAEQFSRDLQEKTLVVLLQMSDRLVGFSTLLAYTTVFSGERINVIYSGDTIVTPDAWGTTALPRGWVAGVENLRTTLPSGRCFWLLLTSGFRTYRFLPVFWREFFPRFDRTAPSEVQGLLDHVARERFGPQFDSATGIVRLARPQRLMDGLAKIPPGRERDPHTMFFLTRNPNHANGDELVCLTELSPENLTAAGRRMMPAHEVVRDHR